jgi:hypothetical protein
LRGYTWANPSGGKVFVGSEAVAGIFGREETRPSEESSGLFGLDAAERERIGTEDDPLRGFEAAMERHAEAKRAEQGGDLERAIRLYETSVAEEFVGSHP